MKPETSGLRTKLELPGCRVTGFRAAVVSLAAELMSCDALRHAYSKS